MLSQDSLSADQMSHLVLVDVVHDPRQHVALRHRKRRQLRLHLIPAAPKSTRQLFNLTAWTEFLNQAERSISIASRRLSTAFISRRGASVGGVPIDFAGAVSVKLVEHPPRFGGAEALEARPELRELTVPNLPLSQAKPVLASVGRSCGCGSRQQKETRSRPEHS